MYGKYEVSFVEPIARLQLTQAEEFQDEVLRVLFSNNGLRASAPENSAKALAITLSVVANRSAVSILEDCYKMVSKLALSYKIYLDYNSFKRELLSTLVPQITAGNLPSDDYCDECDSGEFFLQNVQEVLTKHQSNDNYLAILLSMWFAIFPLAFDHLEGEHTLSKLLKVIEEYLRETVHSQLPKTLNEF